MSYNRFFFNQNEYENTIWKRRESILAKGHKTKLLDSPHFGEMLIVQEIEKDVIYFDGRNYVNEATGEIVGMSEGGYFETPNHKEYLFTAAKNTLPYIPDGCTEFCEKNRVNYFYAVCQMFFEYDLTSILIEVFRENMDFETFLKSIKDTPKNGKTIEENIGVYHFSQEQREYIIFSTKIDIYKWKMYFEHDTFFSDCYITLTKTVHKHELFAFFQLIKNANHIFNF